MFSRISSFLFALFVSSGVWAQDAIRVFEHQPSLENQMAQCERPDQLAPVWMMLGLVDQKGKVVDNGSDNPATHEIHVVKENND